MINKEVKSSERERERERESNNYTRATAIDLKTIDSEVALLSGRATQTPISMEALWNEVQNLKATAKSWEIVTLNRSGDGYIFDSKYNDYKFVVLSAFMGATGDGYIQLQGDNGGVYVRARNLSGDNYYFTWSKSGNLIVPALKSEMKSTIKVLFYK